MAGVREFKKDAEWLEVCKADKDGDTVPDNDAEVEAVIDGDGVVLLDEALLADAVSLHVPPVAVI